MERVPPLDGRWRMRNWWCRHSVKLSVGALGWEHAVEILPAQMGCSRASLIPLTGFAPKFRRAEHSACRVTDLSIAGTPSKERHRNFLQASAPKTQTLVSLFTQSGQKRVEGVG